MTFTWGETSVTIKVLYDPITTPTQHQTLGETQGGSPRVYDYAVNVVTIMLDSRITTEAELAALKSFIINTVCYAKESFTITPDSGHDIGAGAGIAITARYWDTDFEQKMRAWQKFPVTMRFRKENA